MEDSSRLRFLPGIGTALLLLLSEQTKKSVSLGPIPLAAASQVSQINNFKLRAYHSCAIIRAYRYDVTM
jgi:hypothetical protein